MLSRRTYRVLVGLVAPAIVAGSVALAPPAAADDLSDYLNLPLTNRGFDLAPGGVHGALPTGFAALEALVDSARTSNLAPESYSALLFQYRLAQATTEAGIDLAAWDPSAGYVANRANVVASYRYFEDLQLAHRELQWAGMGGQVGADFGGGVADLDAALSVYELPRVARTTNQILEKVEAQFGRDALESLPDGLRHLADHAAEITAEDLQWFTRQILVMQKAIFADMMPMHVAYVHDGIAGIEEFHAAGLIPDGILAAWRDIASGDPDRVARGNAMLLRREQTVVVAGPWDAVRAYGNGVGNAFTYLMTVAGSPSVAGVPSLRAYRPITVTGSRADGTTATMRIPLPAWDWSYADDRWEYVSTELLPRYRDQVENDWPTVEALLRTPYETQFESGRLSHRIPEIIGAVASETSLTIG